MQRLHLLSCGVALTLSGCAGIQGGNEGEEDGRCLYDTVPVDEPDLVPSGFDRTPREIFEAASGRYDGELPRAGVPVGIRFQPDFANLRARYAAAGYPADCGPHLDAPGQAQLWVGEGESTSGLGRMELRWDNLLATARFVAHPGTPLESVAPRFSSTSLTPPELEVHLTEFVENGVRSEWRWSTAVACGKPPCAGGSSIPPGATSETVPWGEAILTRQ